MRYFTKEMWIGLQSDESGRWNRLWTRRIQEYFAQLETLRHRVRRPTFQFFSKVDLHDGHLLRSSSWDNQEVLRAAGLQKRRRSNPVRVELEVLAPDLRRVYLLRYSEVRRFEFSFPTAQPLFYLIGDGIGTWGYDELTSADAEFLRHEILLSCGSTILLEFRHVSHSAPIRSRDGVTQHLKSLHCR